jgi:hypothetical protein
MPRSGLLIWIYGNRLFLVQYKGHRSRCESSQLLFHIHSNIMRCDQVVKSNMTLPVILFQNKRTQNVGCPLFKQMQRQDVHLCLSLSRAPYMNFCLWIVLSDCSKLLLIHHTQKSTTHHSQRQSSETKDYFCESPRPFCTGLFF